MCVIITGPALDIVPLVADAMDANPHGTGIAWVQANGKIAYRKGITSPKRAMRILRSLGTGTAVFHARIATSGGQHALLSHPFRVERFSPVAYHSEDEDYLLFHNGISSLNWRDYVPARGGLFWSDTRALAHALAVGRATPDDLKRDGGRWLLFWRDKGQSWIERIGQWQTDAKYPTLSFSNLAFLWQGWYTARATRPDSATAMKWEAESWREWQADWKAVQ